MEWVDVKQRLPEHPHAVLVLVGHVTCFYPMIGMFIEEEWILPVFKSEDVHYWMDVPENPPFIIEKHRNEKAAVKSEEMLKSMKELQEKFREQGEKWKGSSEV